MYIDLYQNFNITIRFICQKQSFCEILIYDIFLLLSTYCIAHTSPTQPWWDVTSTLFWTAERPRTAPAKIKQHHPDLPDELRRVRSTRSVTFGAKRFACASRCRGSATPSFELPSLSLSFANSSDATNHMMRRRPDPLLESEKDSSRRDRLHQIRWTSCLFHRTTDRRCIARCQQRTDQRTWR
jgi:hypothetical protein